MMSRLIDYCLVSIPNRCVAKLSLDYLHGFSHMRECAQNDALFITSY